MRRFVARIIRRVLARTRPHPDSLETWVRFLGFLHQPCYVCDGQPRYLPRGNADWDCPVVACHDCGCNLWVEVLDDRWVALRVSRAHSARHE